LLFIETEPKEGDESYAKYLDSPKFTDLDKNNAGHKRQKKDLHQKNIKGSGKDKSLLSNDSHSKKSIFTFNKGDGINTNDSYIKVIIYLFIYTFKD